MPNNSKKSRKNDSRKWVKRFFYILIIATFFVWSYSPVKTRMSQKRQIERLNDDLAFEKRENKELATELERLRGDSEYIESIARKKLGMVKTDEEGYVVIEDESRSDTGVDGDEIKNDGEDDKDSWWQGILSVFGR